MSAVSGAVILMVRSVVIDASWQRHSSYGRVTMYMGRSTLQSVEFSCAGLALSGKFKFLCIGGSCRMRGEAITPCYRERSWLVVRSGGHGELTNAHQRAVGKL